MESKNFVPCRVVEAELIRNAVRDLCIEACIKLPDDVLMALERAYEREKEVAPRMVLEIILKNASVARDEKIPICQDTGFAYVFLEIGQDVKVKGDLQKALAEGVAAGYKEGFLRKSVVSDPLFQRVNTGDNTPPIVHTEIVPGDRIHITVMPKGVGSENMSSVKMLTPAEGLDGVRQFIVDTVKKGGPNACPPLVIGVGVGGMMDYAAYLAKKALLRPIGEPNQDERLDRLEKEILSDINQLGVGPGGLGGLTTALAVHICTYPTHMGGLPVAVNLQCHAMRRASCVI